MSAAPTIAGARPIPSLRTKTAPLRRSSNAELRCGELADGVGPIRSLIPRSGPVGPGPIRRASLAAAVSAAARRQGRRIPSRRRVFWPSGEWGAEEIERGWGLNLAVMERTYSRLRAGTAFLVRKTPREQE